MPDEYAPLTSLEPVPAQRPRRSPMPVLLIVLAVLCGLLVLPLIVERVQYARVRGTLRAQTDQAREELAELGEQAELVSLADTSKAFRLVAKRVEPCVVHIDVLQVAAPRGQASDEWAAYQTQGQGSGVIVDPQGYILTNFHVVQNASAIRVTLSDQRFTEEVQIIGYDVLTDLAVLKIGLSDLQAAEWGDSDVLEVGDWVLAIGNPFGLDRSVTAGIVSARQRRGLADFSPYQDFLQTDAAVNPGNSGGPLVNIRGEIIGINTAIVGKAYQGISFAIPSRIVRDVYERLRADGRVERGWLGVDIRDLSPETAQDLGLEGTGGALVADIVRGAPAAKAGLQRRDVVLEWNGRPVVDSYELRLMVAATPIGESVPILVWRGGEKLQLQVTIAQRPEA